MIPYERQDYSCPLCEWKLSAISGQELRRRVADHDQEVHGILKVRDRRA